MSEVNKQLILFAKAALSDAFERRICCGYTFSWIEYALEEALTQQYSKDEDEDDITNVEELCEYLHRKRSEACGEYDFVVENMRNYLFKLEVEKQTERNGQVTEPLSLLCEAMALYFLFLRSK